MIITAAATLTHALAHGLLMVATKAPTKPPVAPPAGSSGLVLGALISGAVIAAVIGALVNTGLALRKSREEERARVRTVLAEAFEAVAAYKEFPYAIRRRRHDAAAEERVRLSEALREVQTRLTYYVAWIQAESDAVGKAYNDLVSELRKVAGAGCRDAWNTPAITRDQDMNIGPDKVDLSSLRPFEEAYIKAADAHVADFLKWRRLWRRS